MEKININVKTNKRNEYIDITREIENEIEDFTGLIHLLVPHTTAGITINENADPTVERDVNRKLKELIPKEDNYEHLEGNSDSHLKSIITGQTLTLPVNKGNMELGTWQGIFFCEYDGPRNRKLVITLLK